MIKPLIIFGCGDIAELAYYYFTKDTNYKVVAFTVDGSYIKAPTFCGLPVVAFETVHAEFSSKDYDFFVALSYSKLNALRKEKYLLAKSLGYGFASYVSSKAMLLTQKSIGDNCFILENNVIQPFVSIGDNVTLWSGNHIGHHSIIRDHVFIASHVVVSGGVDIGEQCFVGVNATFRDHIVVGARCVVGAGALLMDNAAPDGVYVATATPRALVPSSKLRKI